MGIENLPAVATPIIDIVLRIVGVAALVAIAGFCVWFWWPFT